ncbi:MAG: DUF6286 domain-containing protein [Streptosporangiaceae bacterium]
MTSATRMPRGSRPVTAFVAALLAVCACAFVAVQAISLANHRRTLGFSVHAVTNFGRTTHWNATVVLVAGIVGAVIGLGLLLAGLLPPRRRVIELVPGDPALAAGLSRSSLRYSLRASITSIDGVGAARLRGRRRVTVVATTTMRDATGLAEAVQAAATRQLEALAPRRPHTVRVRLKRREG